MPRRFAWASLPDEELLQLRLKDLKVSLEGTWLERCLRDLHDELGERGLRIRPHAWISNEWFSPDDTPGIAIPFYLAHPRLMRLERKMMIDVEGGTVPECMRILRHETGHVVQVAYQLHRRRRWQRAVRPFVHPLSGLLPAEPGQPALRPASAALVRPESPGRRFRRDVRGLAHAALELAPALRGMAGAQEARICRRADGRDRRQAAVAHAPAALSIR